VAWQLVGDTDQQRVGFEGRVAEHDECGQGRTGANHGGLQHAGAPGQRGFDLTGFDTVAVDL
jgi:hypothetical protein